MIKRSIFLIGLVFLITLVSGSTAQNPDPSVGTVTVINFIQDPFIDLDLVAPDHIQETNKQPVLLEDVGLLVQIDFQDNTSSEIIVTLFHDSGTSGLIWVSENMTYDSSTDRYTVFLDAQRDGVTLMYYVTSYDGFYTLRTPETGLSNITWSALFSFGVGATQTITDAIFDPLQRAENILVANIPIVLSFIVIAFVLISFKRGLLSRR